MRSAVVRFRNFSLLEINDPETHTYRLNAGAVKCFKDYGLSLDGFGGSKLAETAFLAISTGGNVDRGDFETSLAEAYLKLAQEGKVPCFHKRVDDQYVVMTTYEEANTAKAEISSVARQFVEGTLD